MTTPNGLTPDDLRVGGRYLHRNGDFVRTIDSIDGDTIRWHDQYGPGICSTRAFLKVCHAFAPDSPGPEIEPAIPARTEPPTSARDLTLRDEAKALTAYAIRLGFLEDLPVGKDSPLLYDPGLSRISDQEMPRDDFPIMTVQDQLNHPMARPDEYTPPEVVAKLRRMSKEVAAKIAEYQAKWKSKKALDAVVGEDFPKIAKQQIVFVVSQYNTFTYALGIAVKNPKLAGKARKREAAQVLEKLSKLAPEVPPEKLAKLLHYKSHELCEQPAP